MSDHEAMVNPEDEECGAEFIDGSYTTWLCDCSQCREDEYQKHAECAPGECMECDDAAYEGVH